LFGRELFAAPFHVFSGSSSNKKPGDRPGLVSGEAGTPKTEFHGQDLTPETGRPLSRQSHIPYENNRRWKNDSRPYEIMQIADFALVFGF
jgi:hypothetical protein